MKLFFPHRVELDVVRFIRMCVSHARWKFGYPVQLPCHDDDDDVAVSVLSRKMSHVRWVTVVRWSLLLGKLWNLEILMCTMCLRVDLMLSVIARDLSTCDDVLRGMIPRSWFRTRNTELILWSLLRALFSVVRSIACTRVICPRCPGSCAPLRLPCNFRRVVRRVSDSKWNLCRLAIFWIKLVPVWFAGLREASQACEKKYISNLYRVGGLVISFKHTVTKRSIGICEHGHCTVLRRQWVD